MTPPALSLHHLSLTFSGHPKPVLDGISLHVRAGERVALVGESGCGKSVTVLALMGLLPANARVTSGEMALEGQPLDSRAWGRSHRPPPGLAMIFQQPTAALNPVFTVGDQLRAVAATVGVPRQERHARALRVLDEVRLSDPSRVMKSYPFQLSGGMRQRILIALALLRKPKVLVADEPGTALDVTIQAEILALLDDLVREEHLALLHITHNLGVARETTDRVYVMYGGRMVEQAATPTLFHEPKHPYTVGLMASIPRLDGGGTGVGIPGSVPAARDFPPGCRFQGRCPLAEAACAALPHLPDSQPHGVACLHPLVTPEQREALWT